MRLRYFAAVKAAAGVPEETFDVGTLSAALDAARAAHDARFSQVLEVCSFVVDGDPVGPRAHDTIVLGDGAVVDCLPPFAGG